MPKNTTKSIKEKSTQSNVTELDELIISVLEDTKGEDILKLNFPKNLGMLFDTFIICSATSHVHANALTENVIRKVREQLKIRPKHVEGETNAEWILIDYFNTVVHVFMKDKRAFYDLENLWDDTAAVIRSNT
ncbi:MAG: ribosome silencing factor [Bacteroidales bacterium]|nr:ribosome silencing factor [Bacteroidales bacterium]